MCKKYMMSLGLGAVLWTACRAGAAGGFDIQVLLDQNSSLPGVDPAVKLGLFQSAVLDGDRYVVGVGGDPAENFPLVGTFTGELGGSLSTVFNDTTPMPDSGVPAILAVINAISEAGVAFTAASRDMPGDPLFSGVYNQTTADGPLGITANRDSAFVPGLMDLAIDDSIVAFRGLSQDQTVTGIFTTPIAGGPLTTLVDTHTEVPDMPDVTFTDFSFNEGSFEDGTVVFRGEFGSDDSGIFTVRADEAPAPIATLDASLPRSMGGPSLPDQFIGNPVISEGDVFFHAEGRFGDWEGLYGVIDDEVTLIVDTDTPVPGMVGETFDGFSTAAPATSAAFAADNERVVFSSDGAMYLYIDGNIFPLLDGSEDLDGFLPLFIQTISGQAISGDKVLMTAVTFNLDTEEVGAVLLLATIPEPSTSIPLVGLVALTLRRTRRQHAARS